MKLLLRPRVRLESNIYLLPVMYTVALTSLRVSEVPNVSCVQSLERLYRSRRRQLF